MPSIVPKGNGKFKAFVVKKEEFLHVRHRIDFLSKESFSERTSKSGPVFT